jgi:uncharacterized membrane protein
VLRQGVEPTPEERLRLLERRVSELEGRMRRLAAQPPAQQQPAPQQLAWIPIAQAQPPLAPPRPPRAADPMLAVRWLARAGILVLALGVLFFLKLAYDRGWVPIPGRFAIGLLGGLALFAGGELMRKRRMDSAVAQVFAGGGAVIAYTTLYVGYALPTYRAALGMTRELDIALLAVVAAGLAAYAVWRNLQFLAGAAAALIHVLVAPAGEFSTVGLVFVVALDAGFLLAAAWRGWSAIVATILLGATIVQVAAALDPAIPWPLPIATAVLLSGLGALAAHRAKQHRELSWFAAGLSPAGLFLILGAAADRGAVPDAWAWSALLVGLASLMAALAWRSVAPILGIAGGVLLAAWPFLHFDAPSTVVLVQAGLAAAAGAAGFAFQGRARMGVHIGALAMAAISLLALTAALAADEVPLPLDQAKALGAAGLCLALGAGLFAARQGRPGTDLLRIAGLAVAAAAPLVAVPVALDGWLIAACWGIEGLVAVVLGLLLNNAEVRTASFALFGLVLGRVFLVDLHELSLPARVLAFLATGALLLAGAFLYARQRRGGAQQPGGTPADPGRKH